MAQKFSTRVTGLSRELQRAGECDAAHAALGGAEPVGVDVVLADAGGLEAPRSAASHDEVVEAQVPVLAERRAPHADDRHRSLIPCDPCYSATDQPSLPEVVVDAVRGAEATECHLDPCPDGDGTRSTSAALQSVSSIGKRPPPSKSTTANTTGGLGE